MSNAPCLLYWRLRSRPDFDKKTGPSIAKCHETPDFEKKMIPNIARHNEASNFDDKILPNAARHNETANHALLGTAKQRIV